MERGDTGLGRDAYGSPRRRRFGDRRGRGHRDDAQGTGANAVRGAEDDDYGQLLRRPGEVPPQQQWLREPGHPHAPQPDRFPPPTGRPSNGLPADGGPSSDLPPNGGRVSGGRVPGRPYQRPRGPADADRLYRFPPPGPAAGNRGRPGAAQGPDPLGGNPVRPGQPPRAAGAPPPGSPQGYGGASGIRGGAPHRAWGGPISPDPAGGPAGPVIRQRETAVRQEQPSSATQSATSIAPDGLESFARDLRALRAKAELDYPQMAELSHYTMKTLASAAGGLRLPTLPVAVAYVRACGGNAAEWEERWQKLAAKITADAEKRRRSEGEEQVPPEPAEPPANPEPPAAAAAAQDASPEPGEVYVITSAKRRQPGWPGGP